MGGFFDSVGKALKGAATGFVSSGGNPIGAVVGGLMGATSKDKKQAVPTVGTTTVVSPTVTQTANDKLTQALNTTGKAPIVQAKAPTVAAPAIKAAPTVPTTFTGTTNLGTVSNRAAAMPSAQVRQTATVQPGQTRDLMASVPQNIRQVNTRAPNQGGMAVNAAENAAMQQLDYQRDPEGNAQAYVDRNVDYIKRALGEREEDAVREQMDALAARGVANSGTADTEVREIKDDFTSQLMAALNDTLNQGEAFRREDVAANEALKSNAISQAANVGGQQFTQGMERAGFSRDSTLANNQTGMDLGEFILNAADKANSTDLDRAKFAREGIQTDNTNQLDLARLKSELAKFNADLGFKTDQANIDNRLKGLELDDSRKNNDFANAMTGTAFNNQVATSQAEWERRMQQEKNAADLTNWTNATQEEQRLIGNLLNALGLSSQDNSKAGAVAAQFADIAQKAAMDSRNADAQAMAGIMSGLDKMNQNNKLPSRLKSTH